MKVNVFGVFTNLVAICAVLNCAFLSATAAQLPLSDEKSTEIAPTLSSLNETALNMTTPSSAEKSKSSENASVEGSSSTDTMPPLVFPSDDDKLSPKNDTALKILQSVSGKPLEETTSSNETSIETTLSSSENVTATVLPSTPEAVADVTAESTTNSTVIKESAEDDYDNMSEESGKTDAENIQESTNEQQEELEEEFAKSGSDKATINVFDDPVTNEPALHSGHVALIFASTLVVLSVLAYVGLVLWRSRLETRYGMRQRLVTEDDYYNNNDVRYFGL